MEFLLILALPLSAAFPFFMIKAVRDTKGGNSISFYTIAACISFAYIVFTIISCTIDA